MGPVVWKGVINSAETGKVNVQALDVSCTYFVFQWTKDFNTHFNLSQMSGSTDLADLEMPSSLDIVGRIRPEMVWEYVNQTRRAGTRDIVVFKFTPASDSDRKHYSSFLSHMYKHNRFAVVGAVSKLIKDFYVVPLPKDSPIPLALVSLSTGTKCKLHKFCLRRNCFLTCTVFLQLWMRTGHQVYCWALWCEQGRSERSIRWAMAVLPCLTKRRNWLKYRQKLHLPVTPVAIHPV